MTRPTASAAAAAAFALCLAPTAQALTLEKTTGFAGGGQAFSAYQPSLALTPLVVRASSFQGLGEVFWFAGNFAPRGTELAHGALLPIAEYDALFSRLGTTYGGDGRTTFGLPDLRGRAAAGRAPAGPRNLGARFGAPSLGLTSETMPTHGHGLPGGGTTDPEGGGQGVDVTMPSLTLSYSTALAGTFPSRSSISNPTLAFAQINATSAGSSIVPDGAIELQGQTLPIASNTALFSLLGTTYGGDGRTNFRLPDLGDTLPVGETPQAREGARFGSPVGVPSFAPLPEHDHMLEDGGLSEVAGIEPTPFEIQQESLSLNWVISLFGVFPSRGEGGSYDFSEPYIGEVRPFLGNFAPRGWAMAEGQLLPISSNQALFSILGTNFGGDGRTTFGLPDLRGRTPIGWGEGPGLPNFRIGDVVGQAAAQLTEANLPPHRHDYRVPAPAVPLPAPAGLLAAGLISLAWLRRARRRGAA